VRQLDIKVLNIIDARCNHEVHVQMFHKMGHIQWNSNSTSVSCKKRVRIGPIRAKNKPECHFLICI